MEFLSQCEDISLNIWFFRPRLWLKFKGQKQKFAVRWRWNFFPNFGHFSSSCNPVFYPHFKNIIFLKIESKLTSLRCFFNRTIFLAEEFLLSQKTFNKMWIDCEKNSDVIWYCESQCERNSSHILTHNVRRLWGNYEWRWIPLLCGNQFVSCNPWYS